jgi:rare lipoprotein A
MKSTTPSTPVAQCGAASGSSAFVERIARLLLIALLLLGIVPARGEANLSPMKGIASWYGEAHRGKPMANRQPFDPEKLTAASWFYPLGTRVRVSLQSDPETAVVVTITDRGPARRYVDQGRVIDLAREAFAQIASIDLGLVPVQVEVIP